MTADHSVRFVKAEANGNDFLVVDAAAVGAAGRPEFARAICDRHRGVGADGVEFVRPRGSGFELELFNADGSEAEVSGNGTRCVAAFYAKHGFREGVLETKAGPRTARVLEGLGATWMIEIDLGPPRIDGPRVLAVPPGEVVGTELSMGNPQFQVLVDEFPANWVELGAAIEKHPHFPQHTNVGFVRVVNRHHLEVRIFERGVGPTNSSGTGTSAAAVAAIAAGLADSPVEVSSPGGKQKVTWAGEGHSVKLIGPATILAEGVFYPHGLHPGPGSSPNPGL